MNTPRKALSTLAALLLTGCGAIMHGPRQSIEVQSAPTGVKLETNPATGSFTTPTTLNLERKNSYVLTFTSPGYNPATANITNGIGTGTLVADIFLGLVGVIVDAATGSWYGLNPETVNVTLTRATAGSDGPQEIHIQLRDVDGNGHVQLRPDAPGVTVYIRKR
jgi:hypothetical protein